MITYDEYYAQAQRVINAASGLQRSSLTLSEINCTGLRPAERYWKYAGLYISHLSSFSQCGDKEAQISHLVQAVRILIASIRFLSAELSEDTVYLNLFTCEEMQEDEPSRSLWESDMSDVSRMNPVTLLGSSMMFTQIPVYPDSVEGYSMWFESQLQHLHDYCITHSIDLVHIIDSIHAYAS